MRYKEFRTTTHSGIVFNMECSKCKKTFDFGDRELLKLNYCPYCGKKLKKLHSTISHDTILKLVNGLAAGDFAV